MDIKDKLEKVDSISPSFCLAKWLQTTIDLHNGYTHSCHHPLRHRIPLDEIAKNPSTLHNTPFKKSQRALMKKGVRPSECQYCWNIEDLKNGHLSDRYIKSLDPWALPSLQKIADLKDGEDINPTYLEVMFDNNCNLGCIYCMASVSRPIEEEMRAHGHYNVRAHTQRMGQLEKSSPLYLEAFWKWLPTLIDDLHYLRITGGEPLLSKSTERLFDYILEGEAKPNLILAINSNLSLPTNLIMPLLHKLKRIQDEKKVKSIEIYTSLESVEKEAEYIRTGMDFKLFNKNLETVMDLFPHSQIVAMATMNLLSITRLNDFATFIKSKKESHKHFVLDTSYLHDPEYLRLNLLTPDLLKSLDNYVERLKNSPELFSKYEINKIERILSWAKTPPKQDDLALGRGDFYRFVTEYDRRKKINFLETFTELHSFYKLAKKCAYITEKEL